MLQPVDRPAAGADAPDRLRVERVQRHPPVGVAAARQRRQPSGAAAELGGRCARPTRQRSQPPSAPRPRRTRSPPRIAAAPARRGARARPASSCAQRRSQRQHDERGEHDRTLRLGRRARTRERCDGVKRRGHDRARAPPRSSDTTAPASCSRRRQRTTSINIPIAYSNSEPRENVVYRPEPTQHRPGCGERADRPRPIGIATQPRAEDQADRRQLAHRVPVRQRLLEPTLGDPDGREVQQTPAAAARRCRTRSRPRSRAPARARPPPERAASREHDRRCQQRARVQRRRAARPTRRCRRSVPRSPRPATRPPGRRPRPA